MIEVVRACMRAENLAEVAEFFSFGTNDLTQATFSFSREDAENKFLPMYNERGILQDNPFEVLDVKGVGRLMALAVDWGRTSRPDLKVGICGEHGGHPASIRFCDSIGLDYVSCSAPRVPIARLAAAHAAIAGGGGGGQGGLRTPHPGRPPPGRGANGRGCAIAGGIFAIVRAGASTPAGVLAVGLPVVPSQGESSMRLPLVVVIAGTLLAAAPAIAEERGFFVGAGVGQVTTDVDDVWGSN